MDVRGPAVIGTACEFCGGKLGESHEPWCTDGAVAETTRRIIREHDRRLAARLRGGRDVYRQTAAEFPDDHPRYAEARAVSIALGAVADILEADDGEIGSESCPRSHEQERDAHGRSDAGSKR